MSIRTLPLLFVLAACGGHEAVHLPSEAARMEPTQVVLHEAVRADQSAPIRTTGTSRPLRDADLAPSAQGRIDKILVVQGQDVKEGQTLVKLDAQTAYLGASQAAASALAAGTQAAQLAADVERLTPLAARGTVSQSRLDQLIAQRDAAVAQARAADSAASAASQSARNSTLKAPFAGTVVSVPVEVGELAGGTLVRLVDMTSVEVSVQLHERDLGRLAIGDPVQVVFPSTGQQVTGELATIGLEVKASTRTAEVVARIPNVDRALRPGMFAQLEIRPNTTRDAIVVPTTAVGGSADRSYVYVVVEGHAARRSVTTFPFDRDSVEIVEGLEPGDEIVVGNLTRVAHGSNVVGVADEAEVN